MRFYLNVLLSNNFFEEATFSEKIAEKILEGPEHFFGEEVILHQK